MKKTPNDWLAVLVRVGNKRPEDVPEGWRTSEEIANEVGKSVPHTQKMLFAAVKLGKVETQKFVIQAGKRVMPVVHYKLK